MTWTRRRLATVKDQLHFEGFPRQWIPIFELFGVSWSHCIPPPTSVPLATDLEERAVLSLTQAAAKRGQLRVLVEAWSALEPLLSDVLYRLDRRIDGPKWEATSLPLTGWQSYGRPEVQAFDRLVLKTINLSSNPTAVLMPCSRARPYNASRTHRRIWRALKREGIDRDAVDVLVVSSIGIVPQTLWTHPIALAYDSGVPDNWRILRLMRAYFGRSHHQSVIDCLEFAPYSDCLGIIAREGLIDHVRAGPERRVRRLPSP